nr:MAG TPA: hypothetical protein [Caudoviricetes sp.]
MKKTRRNDDDSFAWFFCIIKAERGGAYGRFL